VRGGTYGELQAHVLRCWLFFFFQAEDGIRNWSVTGVQTCALPISAAGERETRWTQLLGGAPEAASVSATIPPAGAPAFEPVRARSEERRVGKEGRCRGAADH